MILIAFLWETGDRGQPQKIIMNQPSVHISEKYAFRVHQLLRAAGYDDMHLPEGVDDLRQYIADSGAFYPEDIASGFIEWRGHGTSQAHHAIANVLKAGFFNDGGVEAYASPCTPIALGLAELSAQAAAKRADTRFVAGSADICNLGGLNAAFPDRQLTNPLLAQFIHQPRHTIDVWAAEHGYRVDSYIMRAGGDEFKYIFRFQTQNGAPIDSAEFDQQIRDLCDHVADKNRAYARECGVDAIAHMKTDRAPGVMNTLAMRPIDPHASDIQKLMIELGGDIAAARKTKTLAYQEAPVPTNTDMLSLPSRMPAAYHPLPSVNPYVNTTLLPRANESLEQLSLRMALEYAGFAQLAKQEGLFYYDATRRWSLLNTDHPAFVALDNDTRDLVRGIIEAEHMRGVIDPVSRCYSAAFLGQCCELAKYQGHTIGLRIHVHNLGGVNLLGDLLGDAVLREAGAAIDAAYDHVIMKDRPTQKPMVARSSGGEFVVFLDANTDKKTVRGFSNAVRYGIASINATTIDALAEKHRLDADAVSQSAKNGYVVVGDIDCPKNSAFGANTGLTVDIDGESYEHTQAPDWQSFVRAKPPAHRFVRR